MEMVVVVRKGVRIALNKPCGVGKVGRRVQVNVVAAWQPARRVYKARREGSGGQAVR